MRCATAPFETKNGKTGHLDRYWGRLETAVIGRRAHGQNFRSSDGIWNQKRTRSVGACLAQHDPRQFGGATEPQREAGPQRGEPAAVGGIDRRRWMPSHPPLLTALS